MVSEQELRAVELYEARKVKPATKHDEAVFFIKCYLAALFSIIALVCLYVATLKWEADAFNKHAGLDGAKAMTVRDAFLLDLSVTTPAKD